MKQANGYIGFNGKCRDLKIKINLMNLFIPGMLGKDLDVSLALLKKVLES